MQLVAWPLGLNQYAAGILLTQWAAFVPSYLARTEHFYDLTGALPVDYMAAPDQTLTAKRTQLHTSTTPGSLTYIGIMITSRSLSSAREGRQLVATLLVMTWALRLGMFLFDRVIRVGKDSRFDKAKHKPLLFLQFWTVQGLWVFLCSLPVLILNSKKAGEERCAWPAPTDAAGMLLYVVGLAVEVSPAGSRHLP